MSEMVTPRALSIGALLLLTAAPIAAESFSGRWISDRVDVRLIEVDAVVTDRRGRPAAGLGRDDFELLIDGRPLLIDSFEAVVESSAPGPAEPRPLHLAIYVDGSNLDPGRRHEVLSALKGFLHSDRLRPRDRVLVAAADRFSQRFVQPFTDRPEQIAAAFDRIATMAVQERRSAEFRDILRGIDRLASSGSDATEATVRGQAQVLMARIRADAAEAVADAVRATDTMRRLVDAAAGLDGRKAVLYVGGGLLLNPGSVLGEALNQVAISSAKTDSTDNPRADVQAWGFDDVSDRFHQLVRHASGRRVALYAIDAGDRGGTRAFGPISGGAEVGAGASRGRGDAWAPGVGVNQRLDFDAPLRLLADETGGRAALDGRDDGAALERLRGDASTFYRLAAELPPDAAGSGRIEVRVGRRGLQVSHRKSWHRLDPDERAGDRVRSALFAAPPDPVLEFDLVAAEARPLDGGRSAVTITVAVPVARLAVAADGSQHRGQLSVFIASSDGGLAAAPVQKAVLPLRLSNEEVLGAMGRDAVYRFEVQLDLRGKVAVGVRDDLDPRLSIRTLDLDLAVAAETAR